MAPYTNYPADHNRTPFSCGLHFYTRLRRTNVLFLSIFPPHILKKGDFMAYLIYLRKSRADAEAEARGEGETLARPSALPLERARMECFTQFPICIVNPHTKTACLWITY